MDRNPLGGPGGTFDDGGRRIARGNRYGDGHCGAHRGFRLRERNGRLSHADRMESLRRIPERIQLLAEYPLWFQFLVFLVLKDFLEWGIHNLLHRSPWLWEFHKLHHSIKELDWIGNMRFHWMEIAVYHSLTYFPLFLLNVDSRVILWIAIFTTIIGHLNHSNLNLDWGGFRYLLNSPRLHVWHHDLVQHDQHGQNFGVVFSLWDYLFGTVYAPAQGYPARLGFEGMDQFPSGLISRLIYPIRTGLKSKRESNAV
jgi:sterol desaturase/sphingolipid hydroxylase (fatty acid hydroxylase superfamily)